MNYDVIRGGRRYDSSKLLDANLCVTVKRSIDWQNDYNAAPAKDNCTLFSPTTYFRARAMQWCHVNFSPEVPCCHGNQSFLFRQNWLQAHKRVKRWNATARLYSVAMGQIPGSTERISSCTYSKRPKWHTMLPEKRFENPKLKFTAAKINDC